MSSKRILHVTSELSPYFKDNPISCSVYNLAKSLYGKGNDVRIFMPRFGMINERRFQLHEVIRLSGMNLIIKDLDQPLVIKVASLPGERMQVYFIDNDEYFKRKSVYGSEKDKWFEDNDERAVFFAKGVIETVKKLNWVPDIIHVHGWMASFLPIYLKSVYKEDTFFNETKIVCSVYNHEYEKTFGDTFNEILTFDKIDLKKSQFLQTPSVISVTKEAMSIADVIMKGEEDLIEELNDHYNLLDNTKIDFLNKEDIPLEYTQRLTETIIS